MIFLWALPVSDIDYKKYKEILTKSIHRVNDCRIKHIINWVNYSANPKFYEKFITDNINCSDFYPFANPWIKGDIEEIFKNAKCNKLLRLSTRLAGVLTISKIIGIQNSHRLVISPSGIKIGKFIFANIDNLIEHFDNNDCCICLEKIKIKKSIVLHCGHIFHNTCLDLHNKHSTKCPFCNVNINKSFNNPTGKFGNYAAK